MRGILVLLSTALLAQVTPQTKPQPVPAKPKPSTTSSTVRKTSPAPAKSTTAAKPPAHANPATMTDEQKTIYALGLSIARSISQFDLSPAELDIVKQAITDGTAGKPAVEINTWGPKIQAFAQARAQKSADREKEVSSAYLAKAAGEPGVVKTESGLLYKELTPGTGASPKATDTVKVNYRGTLANGEEFDSSYARNAPAEFALNRVIPCWTEGVQKMKVGGKARLVCPAQIAYGERGQPGIPGGAALVFEIELLDILSGPTQ
ncbi:MAG: FKBP-type peptidyl-prolyl cis-trans isomerase [Bryobacteraceae bacterium]